MMREKLAELCHEQWSGWMRYLFSFTSAPLGGAFVISASLVKRWKRQMSTPYSELSEEEKDSDRKEADRVLKILEDAPVKHCRHIDLTAGNEDGEIAQRIYHDLVERKWNENLQPTS